MGENFFVVRIEISLFWDGLRDFHGTEGVVCCNLLFCRNVFDKKNLAATPRPQSWFVFGKIGIFLGCGCGAFLGILVLFVAPTDSQWSVVCWFESVCGWGG